MRTSVSLGAGAFSILAFIWVVSAAPLAKPVLVTVTKADATIVRGQLTDADPKSITVTPMVKGKPEGEKLVILWSDVKALSNGLTQKRVIDVWKKDHPEDSCKVCQGEGKVFCPTCKGTGREAASAKDCPTCKGAMTVACTTPKCDKGKIPCPKQHIKLTEGSWYSKADGKKWRKFAGPKGMWEISESHAGQIIEPQIGKMEPHDCALCGGKMIIDDPKCDGTGLLPCPACTVAAAKAKCPDCDHGKVACKPCESTGVASLGPGVPATEPAAPVQ